MNIDWSIVGKEKLSDYSINLRIKRILLSIRKGTIIWYYIRPATIKKQSLLWILQLVRKSYPLLTEPYIIISVVSKKSFVTILVFIRKDKKKTMKNLKLGFGKTSACRTKIKGWAHNSSFLSKDAKKPSSWSIIKSVMMIMLMVKVGRYIFRLSEWSFYSHACR